MNANKPYEAPKAIVADVPDVNRTGPPGRPLSVSIAVALLWGSLAVGLILRVWRLLAFSQQVTLHDVEVASMAVINVLVIALFFWIFRAVAQGRNWGRITVLALAIVGSLATLMTIRSLADMSSIDVVARFAMWLAATVLLFIPGSTAWYRAMTEWRKAN
jgi:hypothetical protein